jgi:hypothetical protein
VPSVADMIWCALVASVLLTPLAVVTGSWLIMWVAALLSAYVSFLGLFTIGLLTFLLTCLQLGAAIGLRRSETDPNECKNPVARRPPRVDTGRARAIPGCGGPRARP